jgi:hypothetical protein
MAILHNLMRKLLTSTISLQIWQRPNSVESNAI